MTSWLAALYVVLLPVGRAHLPLNAQWGDLVLPFLALSVAHDRPLRRWFLARDWPLALYLLVTLLAAAVSAEPATGFAQLAKQVSVALIFVVFRQVSAEGPRFQILVKAFVSFVAVLTLV